MMTCGSCSRVLPDSFKLGDRCPNCGVRLVAVPEMEAGSFKQLLEKTWTIIGALIGIALIGMMIWSIIWGVFSLIQSRKNFAVSSEYYDVVADWESTIEFGNEEKAIKTLESYVLSHEEQFVHFSENARAFEEDSLFAVVSRGNGSNVRGTVAQFIADHQEAFTNPRVKELFARMGFFTDGSD
jgi:hypothetical protein